jgi:putative ABC transport system ATP-binding protein
MTIIQIQQLMPLPLAETNTSGSQVWNTDFTFQPSVFYKIQAPSGKGKSTFINILFGNRTDYTGNVYIAGKNIRQFSAKNWTAFRREKFSIVFQDLRLLPDFTALENILLKAALIDYYNKKQIESMMEWLGVLPLKNRKAAYLSYGERQRVAIIRALVQPFEWLLLDEPFSHLDQANLLKASQLITDECHKRNAGIIIAGLDDDQYIPYHQKLIL